MIHESPSVAPLRLLIALALLAAAALLGPGAAHAGTDCLPACPDECCGLEECPVTCPTACCLAGPKGPNSAIAKPGAGYSGAGFQVDLETREELQAKLSALRTARKAFLEYKRQGKLLGAEEVADIAYELGSDLPPTNHDDLSVRAALFEMEAAAEALIASGYLEEGRQVVEKVASVYGQLVGRYPRNPLLKAINDAAWGKLAWIDDLIQRQAEEG